MNQIKKRWPVESRWSYKRGGACVLYWLRFQCFYH